MSKKKTYGLNRSKMMTFLALVVELAKRMGLAKRVIRLNMKRMQSESLKEKAFKGYRPSWAEN